MEKILETIISAVVAFFVPVFLKGLSKKTTSVSAFPWAKWIFAHFIGGALGGAISASMKGAVLGGAANWAAFGASLGIMQWIVVHRYIPVGIFWAMASTIGWSVFAFLQAARFPGQWAWLVIGVLVGILQWFCLVGRAGRAVWWIPINGVAWLVAGFFGFQAGLAILESTKNLLFSWVIGWAIVGGIGGLILGISMTSMSKKDTNET